MTRMCGRPAPTFVGAALLIYALGFGRQAVAVWTLFWYVLLLATEVAVVVRLLWAHDDPADAHGGEATCSTR
jgi:hypothetical protein